MRISDWSSDVCAEDDLEWEKLAKSSGASSRDEILADIGLGKRLAAVVARRFAPENAILATTAAAVDEITSTANAPILIHGNAGQAVQDRKSVVSGKSVSVRVDLGGRRSK